MRGAIYSQFQTQLSIDVIPDPAPEDDGVVLKVKACGICRSDWHGWMGNDPDIVLPHVPGHELAGVIEAVGRNIRKFSPGDRVTLPFVCGCGQCSQCVSGNQQVCDHQFQPGFTAWGGFAEYVAIDYADTNLVHLPDEMDFTTAASLGCRFITSFRAVVDQGKVESGQFVAVWGCGGVGLSAIMIAKALGAVVVAIDIDDGKLHLARTVGADSVLNSTKTEDVVAAVRELAGGGAHLSLDALGHPQIVHDSIASLRKRGKHVQVGIMERDSHLAPVPMHLIIGRELEILGSHGMQAHRYPAMFQMINDGRIDPAKLVGDIVTLEEGARKLVEMNTFAQTGVTVVRL